jgi:protein-disulfide isomerase
VTDLTSAPLPGLRVDDHVRGEPGNPLVVMYGDYACPHCATAHARLAKAPVRLAFRHFALRAKHPRARALAHAAEAAAVQGAFWVFHDDQFANQGRQSDAHLWDRARRLDLDVERFDADRRSEAVAARVGRDVRDALRAGVAGSPTLVVGGALCPWPLDWPALGF